MISTSEVEYFLALEAHRSFTSAAQSLGISQPALTVAIGKLEKKLDLVLFRRTPNGVDLTSIGDDLLPALRRARDALQAIEHDAAGLANVEIGRLRMACRPTLAREPVARLVGIWHQEHPTVGIDIESLGLGGTAFGVIRAGLADVGVTTADDDLDGVDVEPLGPVPLVAVVPESAQLHERPSVYELTELGLLSMSGFGVVNRALAALVGAQRISEATILQSSYQALLARLALQNRGVLFVPDRIGRNFQDMGARVVVPADQPILNVVGAYLPGQCPPTVRRFLDLARARFEAREAQ